MIATAPRRVAARFHGTAAQDRRSKTNRREQGGASHCRATQRVSSASIWRTRFGAAGESGCLSTAEDRNDMSVAQTSSLWDGLCYDRIAMETLDQIKARAEAAVPGAK